MGVCNCAMFCCTLLYVHSSIAIILMGKRELIALLNLSSWCLVMVERFFLAVPWGCLRFVIVVFPDHTHLLFLMTDQDVLWLTLMTDRNCNKVLEINRFLQLLVLTETIKHLPYCIKIKIISSVLWLTDSDQRQTV